MDAILSGMISNLALPPAPPPSAAPAELSHQHDLHRQMEGAEDTPTPPNSSTSTASTSNLAVHTPSATSPSTTPGANLAALPSSQQLLQMLSPGSSQHPQQAGPQRQSRTFFRPPGLGPDGSAEVGEFPTNVMVCPHCGFSCSSKFHYNSHMNTHTTHQCSMCNYQSRTEGRLKKHMKDSHTDEDRVAAGIAASPASNLQLAAGQQSSPAAGGGDERLQAAEQQQQQCLKVGGRDNNGCGKLPATMAPSLLNTMLSDNSMANGGAHLGLESLQSMLNSTNPLTQLSNSDALLKICSDAFSNSHHQSSIDEAYPNSNNNNNHSNNSGNNSNSVSMQFMGDHLGPTALDQLRALAERQAANLLATSTASALGFVGGDMKQLMGQPMDMSLAENGNSEGNGNNKPDTPRRSGKPKQYKCKQCQHVSRTKKEQWAHARLHIPKQKQLTCELCDFVTEYKHHLEYHYRNHNGQKPFKCSTCAYTCVNKSMLNSHMKSHTPVYQFRCQDCTYQTKYCHSLKMHLKKYNHKRAPGPGGSESSDSHGEERPENASSSSVGKDESFDGLVPCHQGPADELEEDGGSSDLAVSLQVNHSLLMGHHNPPNMVAADNGTVVEMESHHRFLLQQQLQLDQMHELIQNAVVVCPQRGCSFKASNIDEMNRHLIFHLIAAQQPQQLPPQLSNEQQALASIYQRLTAQLQEELTPDHPPSQLLSLSDASALLTHALIPSNPTQHQQHQASEREREAAAESFRHQQQRQSSNSFGPPITTSAMLNSTGYHGGSGEGDPSINGTSDSAPGPSVSSSAAGANGMIGGGNHQQQLKELKKEFHQQQQQQMDRRAGNRGEHHENDVQILDANDSIQSHPMTTCVTKSVMTPYHMMASALPNFGQQQQQQHEHRLPHQHQQNGSGGTFDANCSSSSTSKQLNQLNIQGHSNGASHLPFFCQQCEIAFKDAVLYQLHRGYHSIESPFKCNRCGHLSASALEFNLHLYQAKHE